MSCHKPDSPRRRPWQPFAHGNHANTEQRTRSHADERRAKGSWEALPEMRCVERCVTRNQRDPSERVNQPEPRAFSHLLLIITQRKAANRGSTVSEPPASRKQSRPESAHGAPLVRKEFA